MFPLKQVVLWLALICMERIDADLLWEEEFDSNLDGWNVLVRKNSFNNELQYYTDRSDNVRTEGGELIITPLREELDGKSYTSGRLYSDFSWKYGRVDVRAKLPDGFGLWPAIWMLSADEVYGAWPQSGEIDILEARGQELSNIQVAFHYGGPCCSDTRTESSLRTPTNCSIDTYHVYSLDWTPTELVYRFDDKPFYRHSLDRNLHPDYDGKGKPFDQDFYLVLNVAVGGDFLDDPVPSTTWNYPEAEMKVDYVRVHSLDSIASSQCVINPEATIEEICQKLIDLCSECSSSPDLEEACRKIRCCYEPFPCIDYRIRDQAHEIFTEYDRAGKSRDECNFGTLATLRYTLNDPFPEDAAPRCVASDTATNAGLCGAIQWACDSGQVFADVSVPCNEGMTTLNCCRAGGDLNLCDNEDLREVSGNIFDTYYQATQAQTSCVFGGSASLINPLSPLECSSN